MSLAENVQQILTAFAQSWTFDTRDLERPTAEATLKQLIANARDADQARLVAEFFHHGPLNTLVEDASIQEIIVNGEEDIWYESNGQWFQLNDRFLSETTFKNFIDRVASTAQIKVDLVHPFADGRWRDFRVHLGCAPLTHCAFHLTLRRLKQNPWTLAQLEAANWCTPPQAQVLRELIHDRKNLLFIGPTGCGKTTVLGACLKELPESERVVILEDTNELPRPNSASTKMLTRATSNGTLPEVTLTDLVRQSLRMRPLRLVMGEVRGQEAKDLLLALATGHSGSLGTLHASEARQALLRLEMLVQLGAPQWAIQAIRQLIQLSIDALVVCGQKHGQRQLVAIEKIVALEPFGFLLEKL